MLGVLGGSSVPSGRGLGRNRGGHGAACGGGEGAEILHQLLERLERERLIAIRERLLGVGVSGLADWIQEDLFSEYDDPAEAASTDDAAELYESLRRRRDRWAPGQDVVHTAHGPGWVWGAGLGRVTVRFETAETGPGPVGLRKWPVAEMSWRPSDSASIARVEMPMR